MMMTQCAGLEAHDNWCLQALVRGSSTSHDDDYVHGGFDHYSSSSCFSLLDDMPGGEGELHAFAAEATTAVRDELEELYKPFYPDSQRQGTAMSSVITCVSKEVKEEHKEEAQEQKVAAAAYVPKYKRRKNEQKRVVLQVTADDISSDKWAWRKYGQKPIKGSPYPRSYYRCSSSKGCLARKQVEQSCTEPGTFLVTYTAEHNHSQPTRRNSLAGTSRNKFPTSSSSKTSINKNNVTSTTIHKISKADHDHQVSMITHGSSSTLLNIESSTTHDQEEPCQEMLEIKQEERIMNIEGSDENEYVSVLNHDHDMFDEDFFAGLEDLGGFSSSLGFNFSS